jgi:acetyl esterase/lipase
MVDPEDELTTPAPPPDFTVRYGELPDQVADVRLPAAAAPTPLVVVIHGGFWRARYDRTHAGPQCAGLAAAGYAVASLEYRRTGDGGGWPSTLDDVAEAVDVVPGLVAARAPTRVDVSRTVLVGHSAGGHLALWAASRHRLGVSSRWHRAGPPSALRGVVSLAGVTDLTAAALQQLGAGATQEFLGGEPDDVRDRYSDADPLRLAPTGVPTVLIHGTSDGEVPIEFSKRYTEAAGDDVSFVTIDGVGHYELIDPLSSAWLTILDQIERLASGPR